jgi:hypothetical protein
MGGGAGGLVSFPQRSPEIAFTSLGDKITVALFLDNDLNLDLTLGLWYEESFPA